MAAVDYDLIASARRVIEGALSMVRGERVVIVSDSERKELALALVEAASWANAAATNFDLDSFGKAPLSELPSVIRQALGTAQASIFVARGGSGEVELRRQLVETAASHGLRHAHMLGLTARTMAMGLAVDPHRIADTARALRTRLRGDSEIALRSAAGSNLVVRCSPKYRWVENSGIIRQGRWLNLPAGELLTVSDSITGTFVANASITEGVDSQLLIDGPLTLHIEGQRVTRVSAKSSTLQRGVESFLRGGANRDRVGLVSFGTNVGLSEPTGALIVDQTLPGLHLALGMTLPELTGADWDSTGQLVLTASGADIDVDGHAVMRGGRYLLS
jgi:leucyl aminopeptidase (aminopeptidase T)